MEQSNKQAIAIPDFLAVHHITSDKLYAFWQIEEAKVRFIIKYFNLGEDTAVRSLRLFDLTGAGSNRVESSCIHEAILRPEAKSWLFKGVREGHTYMAELGIKYNDDRFFPLLRSNILNGADGKNTGAGQEVDFRIPTWTGRVSTYTYYEDLEGSRKSDS
ncbi:DUF4912 domain-containing protein [Bacillus sp. REN3]|uniref:DUF4912 domain-containing protein n=1 Tax=Bacillus sp. REN3 TaxID=2802440 RepID=UPI001AEE8BFB|nr:DUF4912 domain-containing protein [Bacillus sp. REN3]